MYKFRRKIYVGDHVYEMWFGLTSKSQDRHSNFTLFLLTEGPDRQFSYAEKIKGGFPAKADAERYAIYRNHIKIESMFPRFALYNNYSGYYSSELFAELKTAFREDVQALGFTSYRENYDIFSAMNLWN